MGNKSFVYDTYIATTLEKLWEALTSGEFTKKYFFGREVRSDWHEGSTVQYLRENGDLDVQGKVLKSETHQILTFTWDHADGIDREQPSIVTFKLQKFNETVKLTLIHDRLTDEDVSDEDNTFRGANNGWPAILSNLKSYFETGKTMSPMDI